MYQRVMGLAVCSEGLLLDKKGAIMPRLCRESGRVPGAVKVGRNAGHPRDSGVKEASL